jgi:hypothetical protein
MQPGIYALALAPPPPGSTKGPVESGSPRALSALATCCGNFVRLSVLCRETVMNKRELEELRAALWQRPLRPEEEARLQSWLAGHPEEREDWDLERSLTHALGRLRQVEVPSNLAARVWSAIEREEAAPKRWRWAHRFSWVRAVWIRWAVAGAAALIVVMVWWQGWQAPKVLEPEAVQVWAELLSPEPLAEFDIVARLPVGPAPDVELLSLLQ